jgi:hypothetical protein
MGKINPLCVSFRITCEKCYSCVCRILRLGNRLLATPVSPPATALMRIRDQCDTLGSRYYSLVQRIQGTGFTYYRHRVGGAGDSISMMLDRLRTGYYSRVRSTMVLFATAVVPATALMRRDGISTMRCIHQERSLTASLSQSGWRLAAVHLP